MARNTGKFDDNRPLVAVKPFRLMAEGDAVDCGTRSRRRDWWRRGWIAYADEQGAGDVDDNENEENNPDDTGDGGGNGSGDSGSGDDGDAGSGDGGDEGGSEDDETEPTPVSAEAGATGWWIVTFSDGSTQNMRKAAVLELGLSVDITPPV